MVGFANGEPSAYDGQYLERFDPEYEGGLGRVWTTSDPNKAKLFDNAADALLLWKTQSQTNPLRSDGKPNRPMTALTIEIVEAP